MYAFESTMIEMINPQVTKNESKFFYILWMFSIIQVVEICKNEIII